MAVRIRRTRPKQKCSVRIVASWLPRDVVCIRYVHLVGAHINEDGKPFLITTREAKPPPLRKRVVRYKKR